ncbi:MAG: hypothetical protein IH953_01520 [Chloroflexi bacterium]|nr:hypothetical protein [Chloroflexota bacterium]
MESLPKLPPKLPLSENLLIAIGTFVARFSLLELQIHYLVWNLLAPNQQGIGRLITNAIGFAELLRMLGSLFKYSTPDKKLQKRMNKLVDKLHKAGLARNDVLHSFWQNRPGLEEALVIRMQSKPKGFREELLDYDTEALFAKAEDFTSLTREVQELHVAILSSSRRLQTD